MTELRDVWPRIRVPQLTETPALARLAVAAAWLVIGLLGRSLTTAVLLAVAAAVLVAVSGYTPRSLVRVSWRPLLFILLIGMVAFVVSVDDGRAAASQAALTSVLRLMLLLALTLVVVLPQDAEAALTEAMAFLHLPPRVGFELLVATRVVAGVPGDLAERRLARRSLDLAPGGLGGLFVEPLNAVSHAVRATRQRWRALRTSVQLAALGTGARRSMYRSVSFGRNGRYVLVAGTAVAIAAVLVGLL